MTDRPTVLFLVGHGRSGSTIADLIIGQQPQFTSVGELRYIWSRGFGDVYECGCGEVVERCPFWLQVVERFVDDAGIDSWQAAARLQRRVDQPNRFLLNRATTPRFARSVDMREAERVHIGLLRTLYESIHQAVGGSVVIDSSKAPSHARLGGTSGVDARYIHIVRDVRGVAYSLGKVKAMLGVAGPPRIMPRYPAWKVATRWMATNLAAESLRELGPYTRIRYEDLAADPDRVIADAMLAVGLPSSGKLTDNGELLVRRTAHSVSGNPIRMSVRHKIALDNRWRDETSRGWQAAMAAATLPMMLRYGYLR